VAAEVERRRHLPPPRDPPAHHPDLLVAAPKMEEVAMGASEIYHLRGCRFLKPPYLKPGRLRPYAPFQDRLDAEGSWVLEETRPCRICKPPRLGLDVILYGEKTSAP
jgi:hypothetical protein